MSASIVQQSLELVDPSIKKFRIVQKRKRKIKNVFDLIPENQKITSTIKRSGQKAEKVNLLSKANKISVAEVRKSQKSKEQIHKENLEKLKLIRKACKIELDKTITKQIIERAVTRRPIRKPQKSKKSQKTAFTEEDFKKFEEEYFPD